MGKHHAGKHIKIFTCGMYISSFSRNLAKENKKQLNKEEVKQTKNSLCPGIKTGRKKECCPNDGLFFVPVKQPFTCNRSPLNKLF